MDSTPSWAIGDTGCPVARSNAWQSAAPYRREATFGARSPLPQGSPGGCSGRGDRPPRQRKRAAGAARIGFGTRRTNEPCDRSPLVNHQTGGPNFGRRRGAHHPARYPWRTARCWWHVRNAVPHAIQRRLVEFFSLASQEVEPAPDSHSCEQQPLHRVGDVLQFIGPSDRHDGDGIFGF